MNTKPLASVIAVWAWAVGGPLVLAAIVLGVFQVEVKTARAWWSDHLYVQAYIELVFVGLLPLALTLFRREDLARYGLARRNWSNSVLLTVPVVLAFHVYARLASGEWLSHAALSPIGWPWNLWYAALGVFANGPLEVFFVFWLVHQTEALFSPTPARFSRGLLLTIGLVGLLHIVTTQSLSNALVVALVFLLLSLIWKRTDNALGPWLGWTLINGMTWAYLGLLVAA